MTGWTSLKRHLPLALSGLAVTVSLGVAAWTMAGGTTPAPNLAAVDSATNGRAFELAMRTQTGGAHPDQTMFGSNPSLIADVAEQVAPSVVNIDVEKSGRASDVRDVPAFPFGDDFLKRFFGIDPSGGAAPFRGRMNLPPVAGNGSGVILNAQGYILTNHHVVAGADKILVTLNDGRKLPASLVGKDRFSDLAVLKINADKLRPAALGNSARLRPGEWVLAIGSPLGFDHTVTLGIVSAISRRVPDVNANVDFIQTDAAINPGNSGGPLVNLKGEVIGINTAISGQGQNIGFAIPVDTVRQVSEALVKGGSITRPYIGLAMGELSPELSDSLGLPANTQGVVVSQVVPNSPAARAGFRQGDVIQRINGQKVAEPRTIQQMVRELPLQSPLNIQILRDGSLQVITVRTDRLPDEDPLRANRPDAEP